MSRMTKNDKTWGPFTWGPWHRCISVEWSSGGGEEEDPRNYLRFTGFGWALRVWLPRILRPWREKVKALGWSAEDIARIGRDYYYNVWPREYGFSLTQSGGVGDCGYDFLIVSLGVQTHDSRTTQKWSKFLPWEHWDHVRHSLYAPDGSHVYTEPRFNRGQQPKGFDHHVWKVRETAPASYFAFEDYDGKRIIATCHIEEREWHRGTGWFRWLKWFNKPMIHRDLHLDFDQEVGPEKGSWKGGIVGTSAKMEPGDTPETAFRRFCEKEGSGRNGRAYAIKFIGPCGPPEPRDIRVARNRGWKSNVDGTWFHESIEIPGRFTTEQMLAHIQNEQNANSAQVEASIKP